MEQLEQRGGSLSVFDIECLDPRRDERPECLLEIWPEIKGNRETEKLCKSLDACLAHRANGSRTAGSIVGIILLLVVILFFLFLSCI